MNEHCCIRMPFQTQQGRPQGPALLSNHADACYVRIAIRMMMGNGMPSSSKSIERIVFSLN